MDCLENYHSHKGFCLVLFESSSHYVAQQPQILNNWGYANKVNKQKNQNHENVGIILTGK